MMRKWQLLIALLASALCLPAGAAGVAVDQGWLTLREKSLEIQSGSPLDFSGFFPEQEGGVHSPVVQDAQGRLTLDGKRQRFLCAPMILTPPYGGFPDKLTADRYAQQLRRAGYNLVRLMHVETTLMTDRKGDFDYDPEQLDRFHYFLAALKGQGIYWMIDALSSENGSYGNVQPHRWVPKYNLKQRIFFDEAARSHWREQLVQLYGRKNPYTGASTLADPALLGLITSNEGSLQFLSHLGKGVLPGLRPKLGIWLKARYPDPASFEKTWGQPYARLLAGDFDMPPYGKKGTPMDDVFDFYDGLQAETAHWMEGQLRELGFKGLVTGYNNGPPTSLDRARANFGWVDMHYYHDEGFGDQPGARIKNTSSFEDGLRYVRGLAAARQAGRPFTVSEYGQPFWNQWRREMLAVPAYAALQDWDAICQHASTAVELTYAHAKGRNQAIHPYAVGLDPVARAVETLAALLYRRGDVQASSPYLEFLLPGGEQEANARYWGLDPRLTSGALVMKTMTHIAGDPRAKPVPKPLASLGPASDSRVARKLADALDKLGMASASDEQLEHLARAVNPANRTNVSKGFFESITGEIALDTRNRQLEIRTPKTAAAVLQNEERHIDLGPLKVTNLSVPALVGLSSLDDKPLATSSRMLLVLVSDALNTDMRFSDTSRTQLETLGRLPAKFPPLRAELEMTDNRKVLSVTPLTQSGKALPALKVLEQKIRVDWATQDGGPSIYYLLER